MANHDSGDNGNRWRTAWSWIVAASWTTASWVITIASLLRRVVRAAGTLSKEVIAIGTVVTVAVGYVAVKAPEWAPEAVRKLAAEYLPDKKPAPIAPKAIPRDDKPQLAPLVEPKRAACISETIAEILEKVGSDEKKFIQFRRRRLCAPGWSATVAREGVKLEAGGSRIWLSAANKAEIRVDTTADVSALVVGDKVRVEGMLTKLEPPGDWFWQHGKVQLIEAWVSKGTRQENPYLRP